MDSTAQRVASTKGYTLIPEQVTAINFLLEDRNVMALLPTGYGKSLIFQLFPLVKDLVSCFNYIFAPSWLIFDFIQTYSA